MKRDPFCQLLKDSQKSKRNEERGNIEQLFEGQNFSE